MAYNNFGTSNNQDDIYDEEFTSINNETPEVDRSINLVPESKTSTFTCFKHDRFYPLAIFKDSVTKRQLVSIMAFTGLMITFGMRCNLPIATGARTPCRTPQEGENTTYVCSDPNGEKVFEWTTIEVGLIQSAFFYGYCATQIPAGLLASLYPTNKLFGFSILCAVG